MKAPDRGPLIDKRLALVVAVGIASRVAAWVATEPTLLINDEFSYYLGPLAWITAGPMDILRPPATFLINAAAIHIFGQSIFAVRAAGVLASCALLPFFYLVGRQIAGYGAGLGAAAIAALYLNLIGFSHYLFSETYFLLFFFPTIWLVLRQRDGGGRWETVALGVLCGAASLTREVGLLWAGGAALGTAWYRRDDFRSALTAAAIVLAITAATVAPWSAYLYHSTGDIALVSRTAGMNLYLGNPRPGEVVSPLHYRALAETHREREIAARRYALSAIRERLPAWPLEKLPNIVHLFWPTSYPVKRLLSVQGRNGFSAGEWTYRFASPPPNESKVRRALARLTASSYIAIAVLGIAGLVLTIGRGSGFLLFAAAMLVLPVIVTFPNTRFRLPIECVLIVGTALVVTDGRGAWQRASWPRRLAAILAAATMAWVINLGAKTFLALRYF